MRSAIGATIALVLILALAPAASARDFPTVELMVLPPGTTVDELADAGFSPALMSAGLGTVPRNQTYLDVGQGNRVFDSLYDEGLPGIRGCRAWQRAVERRAESAPAKIVPFLLVREARRQGFAVAWIGRLACAFGGSRRPLPGDRGVLTFLEGALLGDADRMRRFLESDLLIAVAEPAGESDDPLPIGIAGPGFDGNLTSDSTRTNGYVLSTDVAPTILEHLGIEVPTEMSGQPIRSEGSVDVAAIESLGARMGVISSRRGPVVGVNIVIWLAALALVVLLGRGRLARPAVRVAALAIVYLPLVLLLGAALEPGETAERLLVLLLSPALATLTLLLLRGYRALAVASALTVLAYAIDVIGGSPLSSLSLLGPNPGLGVRFYGIGNELEALLAVLVVAGAGAGLAAFAPKAPRRSAAAVFVAVGLLAAFVFAAGRFGADVGAAIVFPIGAVVAAMAIAGRGRRSLLLAVVAAPLAVLALLALVDLLSGANAHLTRSVLDAGGLGDLADVAQRRLQLSAHSFARPVLLAFLPVVAIVAVFAYLRRDRLRAWLADVPALRAGLVGALAATAVGTLANDSGALLLEIGTAYLLVFTGFAWAESGGRSAESRPSDEKLQLRAPHV
ncbi:MAG TPA: hypothetical protein VFN92_08970 [Solirubrobacterales bacterium]|nr:hypothetical protein [Solirubrobacterales bacterium]